MSDDMVTADVLNAAADYLRIHGWCQGRYGGGGGPACLVGAVHALDSDFYQKVFSELRLTLGLDPINGTNGNYIAYWNDTPGRTAAEVITALMETAARIRTGETAP